MGCYSSDPFFHTVCIKRIYSIYTFIHKKIIVTVVHFYYRPTGPDFCIPMKNGKCPNHCPRFCRDDQKKCPGKTFANGCRMPDRCIPKSNQFKC